MFDVWLTSSEVTYMPRGCLGSSLHCALALLACCFFADDALAVLVAFPGAEGAGAYATGGRGGDVYHVTSLNDSGPGTLREGVNTANGPRTIVFDIGGTINLTGRLTVNSPNITIAGQTAPGNGICVANFRSRIQLDNTVVRYMRFRLGSDPINAPDDSLTISGGNNIIIDHVSASWGSDENLSVTGTANNVTVQWSLISEGLNANNHGYGSLIAPDLPGTRYTFHHNLYADNSGRVPRAGSRNFSQDFVFDYRNNVAYNWGTQGDWGAWGVVGGNPNEEYLDENFINNYSIAGPNSNSIFNSMYRNTAMSSNFATSRFYQSGNLIDSDRDGVLDGTNTEWGMFHGTYTKVTTAPFPIDPTKAVTTESAANAYASVIKNVGANFPVRDAVDTRVIAGVTSQTGRLINTMSDIGGFPTSAYPTETRATGFDTDQDGMPNIWEEMNGLDPNNATDRNLKTLSLLGYTNLEMYLNNLVFVPSSGLAGDFNSDRVVDAADYIAWYKGLGTTYIPSDYYVWRAYFGRTLPGSGAASAAAIPEPASALILLTALFLAPWNAHRALLSFRNTNKPFQRKVSL
jgi:pectate lyase